MAVGMQYNMVIFTHEKDICDICAHCGCVRETSDGYPIDFSALL